MSRKLLIPIFALAVSAVGCGSAGRDTPGGDGDAAAADGAGGAAGEDSGASTVPDAGVDCTPSDPSCTMDNFCAFFLAYCGNTTPGYTTLAECKTTYANVGATNPYAQQCEAEHLGNAIYDTGSDRTLHCSHAAGGGGVCVIMPL